MLLASLAVLAWPGAAAAAPGLAAWSLGTVEVLEGTVHEGDLKLQAGTIVVRGRVTGSVGVSAGNIEVAPSGRVDGDVSVGLGDALLLGEVGGSAVVRCGTAEVDGRVGGNVSVNLGKVSLGPRADVGGSVETGGGWVQTETGTWAEGSLRTRHRETPSTFFRGWPFRDWAPFRWTFPGGTLGWLWHVLGSVGQLLGALAFGLVLYALFPRAVERAGRALRGYPGWVVLVGLGSLVTFPAAVLVLVITIVGILGIPFLALGLVGAGAFGYGVAALVLGRLLRGAGREPSRHLPYVDVIIGAALLWAVRLVPVVGALLAVAVALFGIGAAVSTVFGAFDPWFLRLGCRGGQATGGATGP